LKLKDIYGVFIREGIKTDLRKPKQVRTVNAGHMVSDNLGMNLILDRLVKKGKFEIVPCSGFRRVKR